MIRILFSAGPDDWPIYQTHLAQALDARGVAAAITLETDSPETIDFIVYSPASPLRDFAPFTGLRAVLSLWAGVERIAGNKTITAPLCRMVDSGITQGMVEWVTAQVLRHHLGLDQTILQQDGIWRNDHKPPLARNRHVGILGMGVLGQACARMLLHLNFQVAGWSRHAARVEGVTCLAGDDGLRELLARSEIVVGLLPHTQQTENLLDADRLAQMRRGAVLINAGRGSLIDDQALIAALRSGHLAHATLDVFRTEPLPPDHPFWTCSRVTVSSHVAAATHPDTAAQAVAENISGSLAGLPLLNVVNRANGY